MIKFACSYFVLRIHFIIFISGSVLNSQGGPGSLLSYSGERGGPSSVINVGGNPGSVFQVVFLWKKVEIIYSKCKEVVITSHVFRI